MRADLLDAQAAVDWAVAQIPTLEQRLKSWHDAEPYRFFEERHPEIGKKLIKLRVMAPLPAIVSAETGAIINSIRSSLDLLAASLAKRNGVTPSSKNYFPFFATEDAMLDPKKGLESKKWLTKWERDIIKGLKPYRRGNDLLRALHDLDVTRKHERLIGIHLIPGITVASDLAITEGLEFVRLWPGFKDDAIIASTSIDAAQCDFQMFTDVFFNEIRRIGPRPVVATLRDFARTVQDIIQLFDVP